MGQIVPVSKYFCLGMFLDIPFVNGYTNGVLGVAACVFNDKIFMTGGKYGGTGIEGQTEFVYSNDVWSLEKTKE
jgi:hypothetical protein